MAAEQAKRYDPERYWAERYSQIDITRSGHVDLPLAYNAWLYRRKKERLLDGLVAAGFSARGASVLEVAAGTGVYVELWKALGASRVVGIDISAAAVAALQHRFPEYAFFKRDLSEPRLTALTGDGFALVTAIDMLYHVVDDASFTVALGNLSQALAPGGVLAIHDIFPHQRELDFGYIKLRTLQAYERALAIAGLEIVSRTPTFFTMVQAHDLRSPRLARLADQVWDRVTAPLARRFPGPMGRIGYWTDRALGAVTREGPSFEMMICRRSAA